MDGDDARLAQRHRILAAIGVQSAGGVVVTSMGGEGGVAGGVYGVDNIGAWPPPALRAVLPDRMHSMIRGIWTDLKMRGAQLATFSISMPIFLYVFIIRAAGSILLQFILLRDQMQGPAKELPVLYAENCPE